jgi:glutamate dehydrogenase/leucine dehydrogenase
MVDATMTHEEVAAYRKACMIEATRRIYAEADGMPHDLATAAYRLAVRELLERDRNPSPQRKELLARHALAAA